MANSFPVVGGITGSNHMFNDYLLFDGRSLHPLQRTGLAAHSMVPSLGATPLPSFTHAPPAAPPNLSMPLVFSPSAAAALNSADHV